MHHDLRRAIAVERGVLTRHEYPGPAHRIDDAVKGGQLAVLFPGVYALPEFRSDFGVRAQALLKADPRAVLTGRSAWHVAWPTGEAPKDLTAATRRLRSRPGFTFENRPIPEALVIERHGLRITSPALTALDLVDPTGCSLDEALRLGVKLDDLWRALRLTPQRPGNDLRRRLLLDSRDEPWSAAERRAHRALRSAGVRGWRANLRVQLEDGAFAFLDVAFRGVKLALEIDGHEHHGTHRAFLRDRQRDLALALRGWQVVRFAATDVLDEPERFAGSVAALLRRRLLT